VTDSAAFFDLDRTLMAGSSAYYFGKASYREGLRPLHQLVADALHAAVFKLFGASDEKSAQLRDRILESVKGQRAEQFRAMAPGVVEELLPRIRPEAQALLDMHAAAGRDVYIVSASPIEIVGELARALDITGALATVSEIHDGVYTGRLEGPFCYGEGKAVVMRKLMADRGYDADRCYAYSDSASDLPMMQLVGNPVAVNPDRGMMAVAHRRGWPVVEFNRPGKRVARLTAASVASATAAGVGYGVGRRHGFRRGLRQLPPSKSLLQAPKSLVSGGRGFAGRR
jgi:HAD superfamily hydrolase (TIGR01490 family)